jgi:type IV secretory pathway VirB3-like protein
MGRPACRRPAMLLGVPVPGRPKIAYLAITAEDAKPT